MSFDLKHAQLVCKIGNGKKTCRYLATSQTEGFECMKFTEAKAILDQKVEEGVYIPQGDNCAGLLFSEVELGDGEDTSWN